MSCIDNIIVRTNRSFDSKILFHPEIHQYRISVPRDTFGVLLQIQYDPSYYISVRADHDAGRYLYPDLDASMGDYFAGNEIPYYDYYGGYIVRLDKRPLSLERPLQETVTITASGALLDPAVYEIRITRNADIKIQKCFQTCIYHDDEFDIDMPYEFYVPTDYDPGKKYPLVIGLHGTGERTENPRTLVQTFAMATEWAKDSEKGHNQCLVLAPQCVLKYDENDNWTSVNQFAHGKSNSPFWPMPQIKTVWKIIEKISAEYSVDQARLYLTGLSSGAFGVYALAMMHPDRFAALVPLCGAGDPQKIELLRGTPIWIFHSDDDPIMQPSWSLEPMLRALESQGIPYHLTRYPKGQIFWQSGHFCWEVCYHDRKMRDWVFRQKKSESGQTPDTMNI